MAEHYKDYPDRLIFELLNEPYPNEGPDPLNADRLNEIQPDKPYLVRLRDNMLKETDSTFEKCKEYMEKTGRIVWVGEFGVYVDVAREEDVTKYLSYVTDKMEEANIPWAYWEYNRGFGAYDREKNELRDYVLEGLGLIESKQ